MMKLLIAIGEKRPMFSLNECHMERIRSVATGIAISVAQTKEKAAAEICDADMLLTDWRAFPGLDKASSLKWMHVTSAGVERFLSAIPAESDIILTNSSIHGAPMAEYALAVMLAFERGIAEAVRNQANKQWQPPSYLSELSEKTVGIIGLGKIGGEIAKACKAMNIKVIGFSKELKSSDYADMKDLRALLKESDYVICVLPETKETRHMLGKSQFSMMKSSARLISIGRGSVVDETALVDALNARAIAGAALDVFETEPLPASSPLWDMNNVIITPHTSSWSERYMDRMVDMFIANLKAFLAGEKLPNEVDRKRGY